MLMRNGKLNAWVEEIAALCTPSRVYLCDGSGEEFDRISLEMVEKGTFVPLNPQKRPGSFWCHSSVDDVARVEEATFICSKRKEDAGPTNNWKDPLEMKALLASLFKGCMKGRTLYVIPFCMGPLGAEASRMGVQITDSPYVVCNMSIMTRMGKKALDLLGENDFVTCLHSLGAPLEEGEKDVMWPCNPLNKYIVHFPEEKSIASFGSGYGGNALLGKKSFALRIASVLAKEEGWLAEHMLILSLTNPEGEKKYFAAAFPSLCGKTNLAMLSSSLPGWKVETVGDDIAWMRFGKDGRLYAINPEAGFFGVAPGTSYASNKYMMETIAKNTIFTNVALTKDFDVWWEGMSEKAPQGLTSWLGEPYKEGEKAAHPNARFTVAANQCPILDSEAENPEGVPISGIIFGGRRGNRVPLVFETFSWQHGTFIGASVSSETTAAAKGAVGNLRHDPFAMLPFCGYNMADYFAHWLEMGKGRDAAKLPSIFHVNWFRKSEDGKFIWPGFGDNVRVLKWMFERIDGKDNAIKTPLGYIPKEGSLDISGLALTTERLKELFAIDKAGYLEEVAELKKYFTLFESKLPKGIAEELEALEARLSKEE